MVLASKWSFSSCLSVHLGIVYVLTLFMFINSLSFLEFKMNLLKPCFRGSWLSRKDLRSFFSYPNVSRQRRDTFLQLSSNFWKCTCFLGAEMLHMTWNELTGSKTVLCRSCFTIVMNIEPGLIIQISWKTGLWLRCITAEVCGVVHTVKQISLNLLTSHRYSQQHILQHSVRMSWYAPTMALWWQNVYPKGAGGSDVLWGGCRSRNPRQILKALKLYLNKIFMMKRRVCFQQSRTFCPYILEHGASGPSLIWLGFRFECSVRQF